MNSQTYLWLMSMATEIVGGNREGRGKKRSGRRCQIVNARRYKTRRPRRRADNHV